MAPDIPLKIVEWFFQFGLIGFLLGMMALYAIFRGWHYYKLLSGEPEKHKAVFDEAKELIRTEHWGERYRQFLRKVLSKLTGVIGDSYRFPNELPEKPKLRADHPAIENLHKRDTLRQVFGVNPFTVESYQFCFLLALLYPVLSFMLGWVIGGSGTLGSLELLPDDASLWKRSGVILALVVGIAMAFWSRRLSGWKSLVTAAVAVAFAFAGDVAFAFTFAVAAAFTGTGTGTVAFAFAFGLAFGLAVGGAVGGAVGIGVGIGVTMLIFFKLDLFYTKASKNRELVAYWFIYTLFFLTASLAALNWIENSNAVLMLLFYLILPLVNTPLDWLSLGITRALLQSIRFNQHRFGKALLWGFLDLALAIIALLLVSGATVGVVSLANLLAVKPIIDLQALFTSLGSLDNWRHNLWIYFMLLSTLVPTAIHFSLAGGAMTLAVSDKQRRAILKDIDTNDLSAKWAWIYVSVMPAVGFVLAPTLLLSGLYWLLHTHGAFLGQGLLAWANLLATAIDPTLGQLP